MNDPGNYLELIDFYKYLNCPECSKAEFYCPEHRAEVEEILDFIPKEILE